METCLFKAKLSAGSKTDWEGCIIPIQTGNTPYEFEVTARGSSFHLIIGKHAYGNYVCIPDWDVGTELSNLSDLFWNRERLLKTSLKKIDACSVAYAIRELSQYIKL